MDTSSPKRPGITPDMRRVLRLADELKARGVKCYREDGFEIEFAPEPIDVDAIVRAAQSEPDAVGAGDRPMTPAMRERIRRERRRLPEDVQ